MAQPATPRRKRAISQERLRNQILAWMEILLRLGSDFRNEIPAQARQELLAIAHAMAEALRRRIIP